MNRKFPWIFCGACLGTLAANPAAIAANASGRAKTEGRPNILWLTFEDTSAMEFGCYGNKNVHTPNADSLAANGIQFMNAWSCGPQRSPARSSLITGCYATTYAMDVHPVPFDTPADIFFPQRLRDAGYYCTNNSKTHYNSTRSHKSCWDECSKKASYNSPARGEGQPFFAVFNTVTSHMGRIRTFHTDGRRDYSEEGIFADSLRLPDYVPDLPEMRSDYAGHLEAVQDVDEWLGYFLKDLKEKGLDENTIIFFFSDHGGCIPRGKGYLYESGLRVPLIVYFPEKWKHLAGDVLPEDGRLVNFTDLGPTALSLAGVKPPENMHGRALFGEYAAEEPREMQFAFAANHLHHFTPARAVTDGRYKLLRTYIPYRQFAMRNYFQWGMPGNMAWDRLILGGNNTDAAPALPFDVHPAEMLFDLENDPGEVHDLSSEPACAEILSRLRDGLSAHIRSTADLGFFLPESRRGCVLYDKVRAEDYPMEELYSLVEKAGVATPDELPFFEEYLGSELPEMRFWSVVACAQLARSGRLENLSADKALKKSVAGVRRKLLGLMSDENPHIAAEAAFAVSYLGHSREGIEKLAAPTADPEHRKIFFSSLECLSLDAGMRPEIVKYGLDELRYAADNLPMVKNEDAGLMARGILVNLGLLDIDQMYGDVYEEGLKLNRGRRKKLPLP